MNAPSSDPIFKSVFGPSWETLPKVFLTHYQTKPVSNDRLLANGFLDIEVKGIFKLFRYFYRCFGTAPMRTMKQVPCQVEYVGHSNCNQVQLIRTFFFPNEKPYIFQSKMAPIHKNIVCDIMSFGLCWKIRYVYENTRIQLEHLGYSLKVFKLFIPLPITFILGKTEAFEYVIDEHRFGMYAHINHPWFGILYSYQGEFSFQS